MHKMNLERFSKLFDLTGRVAVVTGGAQGNGQAIANALDDAGATVIVTDIVYGELSHGLHESITDRRMMNVTDEAAVEKTMRDIFDRYGKLDILINRSLNKFIKIRLKSIFNIFTQLPNITLKYLRETGRVVYS